MNILLIASSVILVLAVLLLLADMILEVTDERVVIGLFIVACIAGIVVLTSAMLTKNSSTADLKYTVEENRSAA